MIIVVSGKAQDVGKSTLICQLIQNLRPDVSVIKSSLKKELPQTIVTTDPQVVGMADTDTARFLASGAKRVVYMQTTYDQLAQDLQQSLELVGSGEFLIIEGNSVLDHLQPDLLIYVERQGVEAKPSAVGALARADLILDSDQLFGGSKAEAGQQGTGLSFRFGKSAISPEQAELICRALGVDQSWLVGVEVTPS